MICNNFYFFTLWCFFCVQLSAFPIVTGKPSDRGEFFELPDELLGFAGYRAVKVDPVRSMGFKIADYQRGIRESRALFTGGSESVLKGGPKTARDVIERYFVANKARFEVQQQMYKNIQAANTLGTADRDWETPVNNALDSLITL